MRRPRRRGPHRRGRAACRGDPQAAAEEFSAIACDRTTGDEVRLSAAELLANAVPAAAGPARQAIASDPEVGDEVRLSAAEQLAALRPSA